MDVLKQKLNDIGSCIGYPFYFFEDGSYSKSYVNGKMNAMLIIKRAFSESDKCFFADEEIANSSEIKMMEEKWQEQSEMKTVNCLKKCLNDIGAVLNYPFYVFEDGTYTKLSALDAKKVVMVVKKSFASVEGECFSVECKQIASETVEKTQSSMVEDKYAEKVREISFQVASEECVSDEDFAFLIEHGDVQMVKKFIDTFWKKEYWRDGQFFAKDNNIGGDYQKSIIALIKGGYIDIIKDFFGNVKDNFGHLGQEILFYLNRYGSPELLRYVWSNNSKLPCGRVFIRRGDFNLYKAYRKYIGGAYEWDEINELLSFGSVDMWTVFLNTIDRNKDIDKFIMRLMIKEGSPEYVKALIKCWGKSNFLHNLLTYAERPEIRAIAKVL